MRQRETTMRQATDANQIRHLREKFLDHGEVPSEHLPESISRSWQRCLKTGLDVNLRAESEPATFSILEALRERNAQLLTQAQPEMESLYAHISGTQSMVVLGDAEGTILHALGDTDFMDKAGRVALQPGFSWREDVSGTNAIGTALIERSPVFVMGAEHFIEQNAFLNCSASPIYDPNGGIAGVLDLSGDHRQPQQHAMALVRMSALMIENRLFKANFASDILVHFHTRPEFLGTLWEGIAAFGPEGQLIAANRNGAFQLGLQNHSGALHFSELFDGKMAAMLDAVRNSAYGKTTLVMHYGLRLHVTVNMGGPLFYSTAVPAAPSTVTRKAVAQPLEALSTGDMQMARIIHKARKVINTDIPVLIEGETGTGKEILARAMHASSNRHAGPFIAINCASIPEGLIESELFGHEEGAFTGARKKGATGLIQQAQGGTLFLDEIGEMPLSLQARLLRVIQEREIMPLGSRKRIPVDIAIMAATNQPLTDRIAQRQFREDLYYRLNGLKLQLPPLRERSDLIALIRHILDHELKRPDVELAPDVVHVMQRHPWPGNIRQLFNVLRTAVVFMEDALLTMQQLPEDFCHQMQSGAPQDEQTGVDLSHADIPSAEAAMLKHALAVCKGNMTAAARKLGISRATVYRRAKRLGLI